jgi:hypothetical protein
MQRQLFTFSDKEEYSYDIDTDLTLHIVKAISQISYVYFTSKDQNIDIPPSIYILSYEEKSGSIIYENSLRKYIIEPEMLRPTNEYKTLHGKNFYILSSNQQYEIRYHNKIVVNIKPHPCWSITSNTCS